MPTWSSNHRACKTTWSTLLALTQLQEAFPLAGVIPMPSLLFWAGSDDARAQRAQTLAQQMDNIFRLLRNARYEDGVSAEAALAGLEAALLKESNTVADLSDAADTLYLFWQENEA